MTRYIKTRDPSIVQLKESDQDVDALTNHACSKA